MCSLISHTTSRTLVLMLFPILLAIKGIAQEGAGAVPSPTQTRMAFLQLIDRPLVPLAPMVNDVPSSDGLKQEYITYSSEKDQRVPAILLKKADGGRRPAVIVLHGTGGTKEGQLSLLTTLAVQGFVAVAIDGRYHGERKTGSGSTQYVAAMLETYCTGQGHPFLYDTVWDVLRLIDYLATRPDVDPTRIAVIGFSKGGMETYLAAAVDPRIAVAVPMIGVQSFRWALDNDRWMSRVGTFQAAVDEAAKEAGVGKVDAALVRAFYDRVAPGIYTRFDGPAMVPLIAPRPLLVINGDTDDRTPLPGVDECMKPAKLAYHKAAADEKVKLYIQKDTGHAVTPVALQAAVDWLVTWLKP